MIAIQMPSPSAVSLFLAQANSVVSPPWLQPLTTVVGTVIGGVIGYASALGVKRRDEHRSATAVRVQLLCMIESAREVMSGFSGFSEDQRSAPSEFRSDDVAISALYDRAFSADVALALSPKEARLIHHAVLQLYRTAHGIEQMLASLAERGAAGKIIDHIKLPKRVVASALASIEALNAAHVELFARLPTSARANTADEQSVPG